MTAPRPVAPPGFSLTAREDRIIIVRDADAPLLARLMDLPFAVLRDMPGAQLVTSGRAGPVHFPVTGGPRRAFSRPYGHGGLLGEARTPGFADPSRAWMELAVNARALELGLPVAPLVGATATRRADGRWEMQAWSWWNPESLTLSRCLPSLKEMPAVRLALLSAVGRAIRACHDAGLLHGDLNARNILVTRAPDTWRVGLVDLDRARFLASPPDRAARLAQVRRLYRSLAKEGVIPGFLPAEDLPSFVRECVGGTLTDREVRRFLAGCRRTVFWHRLLWRIARVRRGPAPA